MPDCNSWFSFRTGEVYFLPSIFYLSDRNPSISAALCEYGFQPTTQQPNTDKVQQLNRLFLVCCKSINNMREFVRADY